MLTLESVFVTDAFPEYTYVSAEEGKIEKQVNAGLGIRNKIISIVGPSKCGKTTLCDKLFGYERGRDKLLVTGDACDTPDQFWNVLYKQLPQGKDMEDAWSFPSREAIITEIAAFGLPVIIDDFHYIDQDVQRRLCQQMKNAAAQGVRFVVLNTPQRGDDPIRNNQDLSGRFYAVNVNFWAKGGLREIGVKGFQTLKVTVSDEIFDVLAKKCLGSPQLMQTLCLELGREYLSLDLPYSQQSISTETFDWSRVRQSAVLSYDNSALYESLKNGPPRRGQARNVYKLLNEQEGDIYEVIALSLASDPPFSSITIDALKQRATNVLRGEDQPNFIAALDQISGLFETGHIPVEYDKERRTINILDPHFYFYLRTRVAELLS